MADREFLHQNNLYSSSTASTMMVNNDVGRGRFYNFDDLQADFSQFNISDLHHPLAAGPPAYDGGASSSFGFNGGVGSNIWNYNYNNNNNSSSLGGDFSGFRQQLSDGFDLNRMRVQSAATGFSMQQALTNPNGNSLYNNIGRSTLNGAAAGYQPRAANRNGFHSSHCDVGGGNQLNLNRNRNSGFQHMSRIDSNNTAAWISDFRSGYGSIYRSIIRPDFSSLEELSGKIFWVAMDQHGSKFLQNKIKEGNPNDIQMIFSELNGQICYLMIDHFGNYFIQNFFQVCNEEQISQFLYFLTYDEQKFKDICCDVHGTRAVQKLLENLTTAQQITHALSVLKRVTLDLTRSMNGYHVIQQCLKLFSVEDNEIILRVIAHNCMAIATDRSGCCVLQPCASYAQGETGRRIIADITSNALLLSQHPYGNYVVQYLINIPNAKEEILRQLSGHFVSLSMDKYGSNVVEKCLKGYKGSQLLDIIKEIIESPNFVRLLQDPYGNYVAQSAITCSKGAARNALTHMIHFNYAFLHSHPHGKRVLERARGSKIYRA